MTLGLGDFDKSSVNNLNTSRGSGGSKWGVPSGRGNGGFTFPTDFSELDDGSSDTYIDDEDALENVIKATIANLTEAEKEQALKAYFKDVLRSESTKIKLADRKQKLQSKQRLQQWLKYLLILVSILLLVSLVAIVATIIYTSITSGTMSETGLPAAIVSFFSEIMRMLLLGG